MRNLLYATTAIAAVAMGPAANANPITVCGSDGVTQVCNTQSSPANFNNSVGAWTAVGSAIGTPPATSGSLLGNTTDFHTTDTAGATFTLWITETGLTGPLGTLPWFSSLTTNQLHGGVSSVQETTSLQTNNSTPDMTHALGTILDDFTFTTSNAAQTATFLAATGNGPYSITERFIVHSNGIGDANLTIDMNVVPEPASLAVLGVGLFGLGMLRRKRRSDVGGMAA